MQKIKLSYLFVLVVSASLLSSCTEYYKIQKSDDYDLKYKKSVVYYQDGKYTKAITLLEELINILRGTAKGEDAHYYLASAYYDNNDFIMGGYYFRSFASSFPKSERLEEAEFKSAYSYYLDSPRHNLDQATTNQAISALQLFVSRYPESSKVEEASKLTKELFGKLEFKSYNNAKLYYDLSDYKAARVALKNSIKQYPQSKYREELIYYTVRSYYLYANKSVLQKQKERFVEAKRECKLYLAEYANGEFAKEVKNLNKKINNNLENLQIKAEN